MRKYEIIYSFLEKRHKLGYIMTDEEGNEVYHREIIEAYNGGDAIEKFHKMPQFKKVKPEIISVYVKR